MQPQVQLHVASAQSEALTPHALNTSSSIPLRMASAQKVTIDAGHIIIQSASHYLAFVQLFEYRLGHDKRVDFFVKEASFIMYVNLNKNTCYLCYRPAGRYTETVLAGTQQVMLITFRSEWLIHKCQKLDELKPFISFFRNSHDRHIGLPSFGIAPGLFKSLKKMNTIISDLNIDTEGYIFINGCINKYYNKLTGRRATDLYHQYKAVALACFINENFASELADDLSKLAERFMVSERTLARLAKLVFGLPLHEQVIRLRIHAGLELLLTTNKPIYEIALLSGYKDAFYFSKAFKKHFGVSPKCIERPYKKTKVLALQM